MALARPIGMADVRLIGVGTDTVTLAADTADILQLHHGHDECVV